jgi:hypothetical protein
VQGFLLFSAFFLALIIPHIDHKVTSFGVFYLFSRHYLYDIILFFVLYNGINLLSKAFWGYSKIIFKQSAKVKGNVKSAIISYITN